MSRFVVLSGLACLSVVACVDLSQPSKLAECAKTHQCSDNPGGSGGRGGDSTGSGGETVGGAGGGGMAGSAEDAGAGGAGTDGGTAGKGGAGSGGAGGATHTGGVGGNAGSSGSGDAGTDGPADTNSEPDTNQPVPDAPLDVAKEVPGSDTGAADTKPDIVSVPDLTPDLTPDTSLDRPDATTPDAPSCIQKLQSAGYAAKTDSGIQACSECKENGVSKEAACKSMIDCLQPLWPCPHLASCWNECLNKWGNSVLDGCVVALTNGACVAH
jgi:hypothetical protein